MQANWTADAGYCFFVVAAAVVVVVATSHSQAGNASRMLTRRYNDDSNGLEHFTHRNVCSYVDAR